MKITLNSTVVSIALYLLATASTRAVVVTESFDYTAGNQLNGLNGGSGWSGAWYGSTPTSISNAANIQFPSLDFPGQAETGNKATLNNSSGTTYENFRMLSAAVSSATSTSASLSFLFNLTGNDADTGIRFSGLSLFSGSTELIFFGKPGNTNEVGIQKYAGGAEVQGVETTFSSSTVFLFQANFVLNPASSTVTVTLSDNTGGVATQLAQWNNLSLGTNFQFDTVRLIRDQALDSDINAEFDEIALTVIPEPSVVLLLLSGLGLAAMARIRARR